MLKVDKTLVVGWEPAIRGMRNPLESWDRSDSGDRCSCKQELEDGDNHFPYCLEGYRHKKDEVIVGPNDLELMMKLCKAGSDHRKFMRMLIVYADITAPLYWWKEYDTYKVGTVANSCSTMHTIHKKEFTLDDFSHDKLFRPEDVTILPIGSEGFPCCIQFGEDYLVAEEVLNIVIRYLNGCREQFIKTGNKRYWEQMIQLLPSSYNQMRTVELSYETLRNIYHARKHHKLHEWHVLCEWIESLPHSELITTDFKN